MNSTQLLVWSKDKLLLFRPDHSRKLQVGVDRFCRLLLIRICMCGLQRHRRAPFLIGFCTLLQRPGISWAWTSRPAQWQLGEPMFAPCAPWFCLYVLCEHTYGMKLFSREHIYIYISYHIISLSYHIISYHIICIYIYTCMYVYIYICTRPCHHPPSPPHGMGPIYWPHMRSSPSPPWCGGGVALSPSPAPVVWWGCGMVCWVCMVCMVGLVWHVWKVWYVWYVWYVS